MSIHNEWRHAQGLPPLPSKSKRLPTQEEPRDQPSDQADQPAAGADSLDRVLAHLAVSDDDSDDSDPAEEEGSTDGDVALADEVLATAESRVEADKPVLLQAQRESFGAPVDGVAGQHTYYGYASPFAFAEPVKHHDGVGCKPKSPPARLIAVSWVAGPRPNQLISIVLVVATHCALDD
jgi:hypothetical protein